MGSRYDLVLVDPPYRRFSSLQNALIQLLPEVLEADGLLVVETAASEEPELSPLVQRTSRRYGSARLTLFEHADA
jgi:16S rRNA G966 N2-methylase RsmD